jgi:hypothetical protein
LQREIRRIADAIDPPPKRSRGRQWTFSEEIAGEILDRLAAGERLEDICREVHLPPASTVRSWAYEREPSKDGALTFADRYARARALGLERLADEVIAISDAPCTGSNGEADNALVQKQRLQVDSRKWLLSRLLPKQYGDKVTQELVGNPDAPIVTRIELIPVAPITRRLPKPETE